MKNMVSALRNHFKQDKTEVMDLCQETTINNLVVLSKESPDMQFYVKKLKNKELNEEQFIAGCIIAISHELKSLREEDKLQFNQNW